MNLQLCNDIYIYMYMQKFNVINIKSSKGFLIEVTNCLEQVINKRFHVKHFYIIGLGVFLSLRCTIHSNELPEALFI